MSLNWRRSPRTQRLLSATFWHANDLVRRFSRRDPQTCPVPDRRCTTYPASFRAIFTVDRCGNQRLNHWVAKVFGRTDVVEMFTRQEVEARVIPMTLHHGVSSKLVAVPRGENET